jgi:uncharacterized membrane protein YjjB (DUF3815 family)
LGSPGSAFGSFAASAAAGGSDVEPCEKFLLVVAGLILLLPGACSLYFIFEFLKNARNFGPGDGIVVAIWVVSLIVFALGVWLIRTAVKMPARPQS